MPTPTATAGGQHQADRQADHGPEVLPDGQQGGVERRAVDQRRDDEGQDQVRIEREVRAREHAVDQAGHGEQRGGGQAGAVGQELERDDDGDGGEDERQHVQHGNRSY
jgi:hypothetical protein